MSFDKPLNNDGFTLVELLVTIAIISILVALIVPIYGNMEAKAAAITCGNTERKWTQAFAMYETDNDGYLPTANPSPTWQDNIAPYLVSLSGYYISYPRYALRMQLHCPKNPNVGWAYGTNRNLLSQYNPTAPRKMVSITQASLCVIIAETDNDGITTTGTDTYSGINYTRHGNGSNIGFADGHVEFLTLANAAAQVNLQTY